VFFSIFYIERRNKPQCSVHPQIRLSSRRERYQTFYIACNLSLSL